MVCDFCGLRYEDCICDEADDSYDYGDAHDYYNDDPFIGDWSDCIDQQIDFDDNFGMDGIGGY